MLAEEEQRKRARSPVGQDPICGERSEDAQAHPDVTGGGADRPYAFFKSVLDLMAKICNIIG